MDSEHVEYLKASRDLLLVLSFRKQRELPEMGVLAMGKITFASDNCNALHLLASP